MQRMIVPVLTVLCMMMAGCAEDGGPKTGDGDSTVFTGEPVLSVTEEQKQQGTGYCTYTISGPVYNETVELTPAEGSRAVYNESNKLTRILIRDEDNIKTTLMIDLNGKSAGTYPVTGGTTGAMLVVVGMANDDGTMRFAGSISPTLGGEVTVTELKEGGYLEGSFRGVMKLEKQPHEIRGKFRVRMRK